MADRLVRSKTVYQTTGTTITATFAETPALDSTYLLVAVVQLASATAITTPSGWTAIAVGGNNSTNQVRMYVKQGNSSANSIAVTVTSAAATLTLMAYSGFASLTPIDSVGANGASGTSVSFGTVNPNAYVANYGVIINAVGVLNTVTWGSWANSTRVGASTGSSTLANAAQRLDVGRTEYIGSTGIPSAMTDSWTTARTQRYMGVILPLTIAPTIISPASVNIVKGSTTSITLSADGNPAPTFSVTAGTLPTGLSLSSGVISGTATDPDGTNYSFTITATNSAGSTAKTYSGTVVALPINIVGTSSNGIGYVSGSFTVTPPAGAVRYLAYTYTDTQIASAITPPAGWTEVLYNGLGAGGNHRSSIYTALATSSPGSTWTLPAASGGVNNTGAVVVVGYDTDFTITNSSWIWDSSTGATWDSTTGAAPMLTASSDSLVVRALLTWQNAYSSNFPYPSTEPYGQAQFIQSSAANVMVAHSKVTSGASTVATTWGGNEWDSTATLLLATSPVTPAVTTTYLNTLSTAAAFSQTLVASGGGTLTWTVTAGSLPAGISLSTGGVLSGTPTATGSYSFTVTVTNSAGSGTKAYSGTVTDIPQAIAAYNFDENTGSTSADITGNGYTATVTAWATGHTASGANGDGSHAAAIVKTGTMLISAPTALTFMAWLNPTTANDTFVVFNTAWSANVFGVGWADSTHMKMWANTQTGAEATASVTTSLGTWVHVAVVVTTTSSTLYLDGVSVATQTLSGTLPDVDWMSLGGVQDAWSSPNSGVIDDVRLFNVALTSGQVNSLMNTPLSSSPTTTPVITTSALTSIVVGQVFSQTLAATGGGTITWSVSVGSLPAGLSLSSGGVLSGTPTTAGSYSFTVTATNSGGTGTKSYIGTVTLPLAIAAYNFDEGVGTIARDWSGNGRTLSMYAQTAPVWGNGHGSGGSALGTGTISQVNNGAKTGLASTWFDPTQPWAIVWWARGTFGYGQPGRISGYTSTATYSSPAFKISFDKNTFGIEGSSIYVFSGSNNDNNWHHYAVVYDGTTTTGYIDATAAGSTTAVSYWVLGVDSPIYINAPDLGWTDSANDVQVDDLRIFQSAINLSAITQFMNTPVTGTAPLWLTKTSGGMVTVGPYLLTSGSLLKLGG